MEQSWDRLWNEFQSEALKHEGLFFHPENKPLHVKSAYAPTEHSAWHKRLLQGEVHDENAWALGGVAPHAGLFGSIEGVAQWGLWLRHVYLGKDKWLKQKTLRTFSHRAMPPAKGDWALGFMLPTEGSASCGPHFSLKSFGHTGFTGTSFWFDPEKDVFVVLLSNRIHPTRDNEQFRQWRPRIHDWVIDILEKKELR